MKVVRVMSIALTLAALSAVVAPASARIVSTRAAKVNDQGSAASVMHRHMHRHVHRHMHRHM